MTNVLWQLNAVRTFVMIFFAKIGKISCSAGVFTFDDTILPYTIAIQFFAKIDVSSATISPSWSLSKQHLLLMVSLFHCLQISFFYEKWVAVSQFWKILIWNLIPRLHLYFDYKTLLFIMQYFLMLYMTLKLFYTQFDC